MGSRLGDAITIMFNLKDMLMKIGCGTCWALTSIMLVFSGCWAVEGETSQLSLQEARAMVGEELQIGMEPSEILTFLKKHQFEILGYRAKEKAIFAIKRNTRQMSLGVTSSIQMKFFFDNNRKLQDYSVEETFTGP